MTPELTVEEGGQGLKVRNLRKSYRKRPVIRDVSLDLNRGEVVALLGPNGSGKTTCFYSIAGLVMPDGGEVIIDGQDVTTFPMYRRAKLGIGYLPQERSIFQGLNVEDNILAILEIVEKDRTKRRERLDELLNEFMGESFVIESDTFAVENDFEVEEDNREDFFSSLPISKVPIL